MGATKISDIIQPELFAQYVIDRSAEKSELMYAGAIQNNPRLTELITGGGTVLHMPKWNDLTGESETMDDTNPITVNNITTKAELATLLIRAKAWGAHELSGALAGDDPMRAIANLVSEWWIRDEKKTVLSILDGVFASASMSDLVLDISSASSSAIGPNAVLDAKQLMGDNASLLTMLYMHSAVYTELQKQNVIQFIPNSESKIQFPTYLGYRVVCDDSCPFLPKAKAVYKLTITGTATVGDTLTVDGVTYTAAAADPATTVASTLKTALEANATFNGKFTIGITGSVLTFTQKSDGVGDIPTVSTSAGATITANIETVTPGSPKTIYTTYLLSQGCIQRGNGVPVSLTPVETDRDSLMSTDILINRQAKVLHPKGISWIGSGAITKPTPTNSDLKTGTNWNRVSEIKKIGMVKLLHTI